MYSFNGMPGFTWQNKLRIKGVDHSSLPFTTAVQI